MAERRHYIVAEITEDQVHAINEIAGNEFKRPIDIASDAVSYYIEHYHVIAKSDEFKFWSIVHSSRAKRSRFDQLKQLAYTWQQSQDDADMEILEQACEVEGIEIEIILGALTEAGAVLGDSVVIKNPKGKAAARLWLAELLVKFRKLPVKQIEALAVERGFNWNTVKSAKGDLVSEGKIISNRQPENWTWDWVPSDAELAEDLDMPDLKLNIDNKDREEQHKRQ